MIVTIGRWISEKGGYAFVEINGSRTLLTLSVITVPTKVRITGRDLSGYAIDVDPVDVKDGKIAKAKLQPKTSRWVEGNVITLVGDYALNWSSEVKAAEFKVYYFDFETKRPIWDEDQFKAAEAAGCPQQILNDVKATFEKQLETWKKNAAFTADYRAAVEAAKSLLPTLGNDKFRFLAIWPLTAPTLSPWETAEENQKRQQSWNRWLSDLFGNAIGENETHAWGYLQLDYRKISPKYANHRVVAEWSRMTAALLIDEGPRVYTYIVSGASDHSAHQSMWGPK